MDRPTPETTLVAARKFIIFMMTDPCNGFEEEHLPSVLAALNDYQELLKKLDPKLMSETLPGSEEDVRIYALAMREQVSRLTEEISSLRSKVAKAVGILDSCDYD